MTGHSERPARWKTTGPAATFGETRLAVSYMSGQGGPWSPDMTVRSPIFTNFWIRFPS